MWSNAAHALSLLVAIQYATAAAVNYYPVLTEDDVQESYRHDRNHQQPLMITNQAHDNVGKLKFSAIDSMDKHSGKAAVKRPSALFANNLNDMKDDPNFCNALRKALGMINDDDESGHHDAGHDERHHKHHHHHHHGKHGKHGKKHKHYYNSTLSIYSNLAANEDFSKLVHVIDAHPEFKSVLNGSSDESVTFFAPPNFALRPPPHHGHPHPGPPHHGPPHHGPPHHGPPHHGHHGLHGLIDESEEQIDYINYDGQINKPSAEHDHQLKIDIFIDGLFGRDAAEKSDKAMAFSPIASLNEVANQARAMFPQCFNDNGNGILMTAQDQEEPLLEDGETVDLFGEGCKEKILEGLLYHTVSGVHNLSDTHYTLLDTELKSEGLNGKAQKLRVYRRQDGTLSFNIYSHRIVGDLATSNGLLNIISHVILPPPPAASAMRIVPHVFGIFLAGLKFTGMYDVLNEVKEATVFAPSNRSFKKLGARRLAYLFSPSGKSDFAKLLSHHIGRTLHYIPDLISSKGASIESLAGDKIEATLGEYKDHPIIKVGDAVVVIPDGIVQNGVLHLISSVLGDEKESDVDEKNMVAFEAIDTMVAAILDA